MSATLSVSLWTARHHDPHFERLSLSPPTARLLQLPQDVAEMDPSNVTGVVDRLEKAGLVARGSAPNDRRAKTFVLTPAAAGASGPATRAAVS